MEHRLLLVAAILLCLSIPRAYSQDVGLDFYDNLAALPYLYPHIEARYVSSYDRTGGNDDGFRGTYSALYLDKNGEQVIFDEDGPGCVYNLCFTDIGGETSPLRWGTIKFYFDSEPTPRVSVEANDLFSGRIAPFVFPLVTHNYISSGAYSCSLPFPFARHLKVTTEKRVGFYNMYYHLYKDKQVTSWSGKEDYGRLISLFERCGSDPKRTVPVELIRKHVSLPKRRGRDKLEPAVLLSRKGGGTIQAIKINPLFPPDEYALNHIFLRITWDDQQKAAVNVPIGPFFGSDRKSVV